MLLPESKLLPNTTFKSSESNSVIAQFKGINADDYSTKKNAKRSKNSLIFPLL